MWKKVLLVARAAKPRTILEELRTGRYSKRGARRHHRKHDRKPLPNERSTRSRHQSLLGDFSHDERPHSQYQSTKKCRLEDGSILNEAPDTANFSHHKPRAIVLRAHSSGKKAKIIGPTLPRLARVWSAGF